MPNPERSTEPHSTLLSAGKFHFFRNITEYLDSKKGVIDQGRVFLNALTSRLTSIKEKCDNLTFCAMIHPKSGELLRNQNLLEVFE